MRLWHLKCWKSRTFSRSIIFLKKIILGLSEFSTTLVAGQEFECSQEDLPLGHLCEVSFYIGTPLLGPFICVKSFIYFRIKRCTGRYYREISISISLPPPQKCMSKSVIYILGPEHLVCWIQIWLHTHEGYILRHFISVIGVWKIYIKVQMFSYPYI